MHRELVQACQGLRGWSSTLSSKLGASSSFHGAWFRIHRDGDPAAVPFASLTLQILSQVPHPFWHLPASPQIQLSLRQLRLGSPSHLQLSCPGPSMGPSLAGWALLPTRRQSNQSPSGPTFSLLPTVHHQVLLIRTLLPLD